MSRFCALKTSKKSAAMTKHKNDTASKGATMMQAIGCVGWQKLVTSFFNTVKLLEPGNGHSNSLQNNA